MLPSEKKLSQNPVLGLTLPPPVFFPGGTLILYFSKKMTENQENRY